MRVVLLFSIIFVAYSGGALSKESGPRKSEHKTEAPQPNNQNSSVFQQLPYPLPSWFSAQGRRQLTLEPNVGLIIFGFDAPQRDDPGWQKHLQRLKANIPHVIAVGTAKQIRI